MSKPTDIEKLKALDQTLRVMRKINTALPKRKAKKFDDAEEALLTRRTVLVFNIVHSKKG